MTSRSTKLKTLPTKSLAVSFVFFFFLKIIIPGSNRIQGIWKLISVKNTGHMNILVSSHSNYHHTKEQSLTGIIFTVYIYNIVKTILSTVPTALYNITSIVIRKH